MRKPGERFTQRWTKDAHAVLSPVTTQLISALHQHWTQRRGSAAVCKTVGIQRVIYLYHARTCSATLPRRQISAISISFTWGFSVHKPASLFLCRPWNMFQPHLALSQVKGSVSQPLLPVHLTWKKEECRGGGLQEQLNSLLFFIEREII